MGLIDGEIAGVAELVDAVDLRSTLRGAGSSPASRTTHGVEMSNVVDLPVITKLDLDPQRILMKASEAGLEKVIVIGVIKGGDEFFASSVSDGGDVVWQMERAKLKLLRIVD